MTLLWNILYRLTIHDTKVFFFDAENVFMLIYLFHVLKLHEFCGIFTLDGKLVYNVVQPTILSILLILPLPTSLSNIL